MERLISLIKEILILTLECCYFGRGIAKNLGNCSWTLRALVFSFIKVGYSEMVFKILSSSKKIEFMDFNVIPYDCVVNDLL